MSASACLACDIRSAQTRRGRSCFDQLADSDQFAVKVRASERIQRLGRIVRRLIVLDLGLSKCAGAYSDPENDEPLFLSSFQQNWQLMVRHEIGGKEIRTDQQ